jgi:hypothetical protein
MCMIYQMFPNKVHFDIKYYLKNSNLLIKPVIGLINGLLEPNYKRRLTVDEVLNNDWIKVVVAFF